jgi:hypothetical protein
MLVTSRRDRNRMFHTNSEQRWELLPPLNPPPVCFKHRRMTL